MASACDAYMHCLQDTAVILGREQARLQEELELVRRQVAQLAHVMQVTANCGQITERQALLWGIQVETVMK